MKNPHRLLVAAALTGCAGCFLFDTPSSSRAPRVASSAPKAAVSNAPTVDAAVLPVAPWNDAALLAVPGVHAASLSLAAPGLKCGFLDGMPYKGNPTRFFAYWGLPKGASVAKPVPGIVLVHGGGGSAVADWVRRWNARGYAAIAFDNCGGVPRENGKPSANGGRWATKWDRHPFSGPAGWDEGYRHVDDPVTDQWAYHAVADGIRARVFLASLPGVDASRIGVTGLSYGGYLTCLIASVDPAFAFAAPVYGCGFIREHSAWSGLLTGDAGAKWGTLWEPALFLPHATCPFLWVDSTSDHHYPLDSVKKSAALTKGTTHFAVIKDLVHGHVEGEAPEEIAAFADWVVKGCPAPVSFGPVSTDGGVLEADFRADGRKIAKAEFVWTTDTADDWSLRTWQARPIEGFDPASGHVQTFYPSDATCYFVNLTDEAGLVHSSDWVLAYSGDADARCAWAQERTEPRTFTALDGKQLAYRWHEPAEKKPGEKYPLVVFLHGAGERGEENIRQMIHGVPQLLSYGERKNVPFFLVAGQVSGEAHPTDPQGYKWVQVKWDGPMMPMPEEPSVAMGALIDLIGKLRQNPAVDTSRIYVTGLSMGGYGTWDLAMRRPGWFAAIMPLCGGADEAKIALVKDIPASIYHGGDDMVVPTVRGSGAAAALKAAGGTVRYTEYEAVGHDCWTATYGNDATFDWLFAQKREQAAK